MKMPRGLSHDEVKKRLQKAGWVLEGHSGDHSVLRKNGNPVRIHLPYRSYVRVGTLAHILRAANMTVEEFERLKK